MAVQTSDWEPVATAPASSDWEPVATNAGDWEPVPAAPNPRDQVGKNLVSTTAGGTTGGGLSLTPFTESDIPDAADVSQVFQDISRPAVALPKFTVNPSDSKTKSVLK